MLGSVTHPLDLAKRATLIILNEEMDDIMKVTKVPWRIWFINKRR